MTPLIRSHLELLGPNTNL